MKCPRCNGAGTLAPEGVRIGDLVAAHREAKGLTQKELADAASISRGQLANLEVGRTDPSLALLRRLALALECSAKDLVP